jgi:hypothetical protein
MSETFTEHDIEMGARDREDLPPAGDDLCHIESGDGRTYYCGRTATGETTCRMYNGEAVCPSCGLATCPSCAVMSSLNERLVDEP